MSDDADEERVHEIESLLAEKGKRFRIRPDDNGTWTASTWSVLSTEPIGTAQPTSNWNRPTKLAAAEAALRQVEY
jgi:hypothetical protein